MNDPTNPLWPADRGTGLLHGHVAHGLKPSHGAIADVIDGEAVEAIGGEGRPDWILLAVVPAPDPPIG